MQLNRSHQATSKFGKHIDQISIDLQLRPKSTQWALHQLQPLNRPVPNWLLKRLSACDSIVDSNRRQELRMYYRESSNSRERMELHLRSMVRLLKQTVRWTDTHYLEDRSAKLNFAKFRSAKIISSSPKKCRCSPQLHFLFARFLTTYIWQINAAFQINVTKRTTYANIIQLKFRSRNQLFFNHNFLVFIIIGTEFISWLISLLYFYITVLYKLYKTEAL